MPSIAILSIGILSVVMTSVILCSRFMLFIALQIVIMLGIAILSVLCRVTSSKITLEECFSPFYLLVTAAVDGIEP